MLVYSPFLPQIILPIGLGQHRWSWLSCPPHPLSCLPVAVPTWCRRAGPAQPELVVQAWGRQQVRSSSWPQQLAPAVTESVPMLLPSSIPAGWMRSCIKEKAVGYSVSPEKWSFYRGHTIPFLWDHGSIKLWRTLVLWTWDLSSLVSHIVAQQKQGVYSSVLLQL